MKTTMENLGENLLQLLEQEGLEFNVENFQRCIQIAHTEMRAGRCSVEAYYRAKEVLLATLEVSNTWIN